MEKLFSRRKKARRTTPTRAFPFENLPKVALLEIYRRLSEKELAQAMCVSKPWRQLILRCLPSIAPPALHYLGLLMRLDSDTETTQKQKSSGISVALSEEDGIHVGPYNLLRWCSRVMQCKTTAQMLLDCCNGLLLFCHREGKAEILSNISYYYYVLNPITKQCVAVLKLGRDTSRFKNAALAYDPTESTFFKIVQFQGCRQLNVFSSETGEWENLKTNLPVEVTRSTWDKKSVFLKGAVYRISDSGHLVKFFVDFQGKVRNQAVAIDLPANGFTLREQSIGVNNKKINVAMVEEESVFIWELDEEFDEQGECTFGWTLMHRAELNPIRAFGTSGQTIAIHPYNELLFFTVSPKIYFYHYSSEIMVSRDHKQYSAAEDWFTAFPILGCSMPFTCYLNKKSTFERLSAPRVGRRGDEDAALI